MLTALVLSAAFAQDAPQLAATYAPDPVKVQRFRRARKFAHFGQGAAITGFVLAAGGGAILLNGMYGREPRYPLASFAVAVSGLGLVVIGAPVAVLSPIVFYASAGYARTGLLRMGVEVDGRKLSTAWALWVGSLAVLGASGTGSEPAVAVGAVSVATAMQISALILGSLQLGANSDAAWGAGIARSDREPLHIVVAPWTDGYRQGALVAFGF